MNRDIASPATGPLAGLRVIEMAGIGPGPFACMLLSDLGAEVVRVDRNDAKLGDRFDIVGRGRKTVLLDLKNQADVEKVLELVSEADVLVEGFRPGVMERLGLGPADVEKRNPKLVYGRMTGWGQDGPLARAAGHDINYIAISGALAAIGEAGRAPVPPLNLVGDYGGGSLYLVVGILAAVFEAQRSGKGQVVDAAICDGAVSLTSLFHTLRLRGHYVEKKASNVLDGGAPYYKSYETADGEYVSVGPIEPKFFALLCEKLGVPAELQESQNDRARWSELEAFFAETFRTETRAHWCELLEGTDACFAPVLTLSEAEKHPHLQHRESFVSVDGVQQPAPAPRFSRTPGSVQGPAPKVPVSPADLLEAWRGSSRA